MNLKKYTSSVLCFAIGLSLLSGCQGVPSTPSSHDAPISPSSELTSDYSSVGNPDIASTEVSEIIESIPYDISDLSPWSSATSGRLQVLQTIYEYMAYYDATQPSGLNGILMESYEKLDNYVSRVKIYDYIYDSAGNHLTAKDVAFSFNTWRDNGKSVKCKLLDSVTVVDEYTVDIKLKVNSVGDVENMLCGLVPIVTQVAYEGSGDNMLDNVVSTSPYIVKDFVSGSHLTVVKNEKYWQTNSELILPVSRANAKQIVFKIIMEKAQVSVNLETNVTDIAGMVAGSEVGRFEANPDYNVFSVAGGNVYFMSYNCDPEKGIFAENVAFRKAVSYAVDVSGLIQGVLKGRGFANHAFANPVCVDYNPEWDKQPYYDYNLDTAKQLLADSGYDVSKPVRIMYTSSDTFAATATIIQSYLMELGLKCELIGYESALFQTYKTEPGEWDIILDAIQSVDYVSSASSKLQISGNTPAVNFMQDTKMQDMIMLIQSNEGHTQENVNTYMDYLKEQCYVYAMFNENYNHIVEKEVPSIFVNFKGYLVPGACTYDSTFAR